MKTFKVANKYMNEIIVSMIVRADDIERDRFIDLK